MARGEVYDEAMFSRAERCAEAAFRLCLVMSNTYGITLNSEWIERAATEKVSETVAAAVLLICESRPVHEVVAKLTPGEFERVVDVVHRSPDHFPSGTLAALESHSPLPAGRPQSYSVPTDQAPRQGPIDTKPDGDRERGNIGTDRHARRTLAHMNSVAAQPRVQMQT